MPDKLMWQPGQDGKGIVDQDGGVHTFDSEEYELHNDYVAEHPEVGTPLAYFYIDPRGEVDIVDPSRQFGEAQKHDLMMETILEAEPLLHEATESGGWKF